MYYIGNDWKVWIALISNRSFYILLDVLIFCKYDLISVCQLVKKFHVISKLYSRIVRANIEQLNVLHD